MTAEDAGDAAFVGEIPTSGGKVKLRAAALTPTE